MVSGTRRPEDEDLAAAWDMARAMLGAALPRRWQHSQGVCRAAVVIGAHVGEDCGVLGQAAMLHDIGYSPTIVETVVWPGSWASFRLNVTTWWTRSYSAT